MDNDSRKVSILVSEEGYTIGSDGLYVQKNYRNSMTSRYIETCTNRRDNVTRQELVPVTRQVETEGSGPFHKR